MRLGTIALLAALLALWLYGLAGQTYSAEAAMRYLTLSLALVAFGVWRWQPRAARRRFRDRRRPPPE
jgi:hypothetical protein